jgi:hypothetical protein
MIVAHAIAQVDDQRQGLHVLFSGPHAWIYAPDGWLVERRLWQRPKGRRLCANLRDKLLIELRRERELQMTIGLATLREGTWIHPAGGPPGEAEVLTVDLTEATTMATVAMPGPNWTTYAMRSGKVVAAAPAQTAPGQVILNAPAIDRVVVHAQHADGFQVCAILDETSNTGWLQIAHLQLPLGELDPSLGDEDDEWALAQSRLIVGDELERATFAELASTLRALVGDDEVRPIDRSIRPDPASPDTVVGALDPLRLALIDPVMRRALGLAHFDDDPALQLGETYQYRVSANFPPDADAARPGFHTVPVGTQVPADLFLGDVRVRLSQPSRVDFVPTGATGDLAGGLRAVPLGPRVSPHWLLPDLLDAAVVLEFATPRNAIILQFADHVDLRFDAFDADGGAVGGGDLPDASETVLTFSGAAARVILRGKARWRGLREVTGPAGSVHLSAISEPIVLAEPPPPPQPLAITVTRAGLSTPSTPSEPRPRSQLGFDVVWRPTLAFAANAWPPDADAAPPLATTRFELQHEHVGEGFRPVYGEGGLVFGDRARRAREPLSPGADVTLHFPEQPAPPVGAVQDHSIRDHFLREPEISLPAPGTHHRYRVRALDEIGRPAGEAVPAAPTGRPVERGGSG